MSNVCLCLPTAAVFVADESLWELLCFLFICFLWCTTTILQLPSPDKKSAATNKTNSATWFVMVIPLRRHFAAVLFSSWHSSPSLELAGSCRLHTSPLNLSRPDRHNNERALRSSSRGGQTERRCCCSGVIFSPALAGQLLAESSWTLQIFWRVQQQLNRFVCIFTCVFLLHSIWETCSNSMQKDYRFY